MVCSGEFAHRSSSTASSVVGQPRGSCTAEGHILPNSELIVAPILCNEYIEVHELSHLQEHNHGNAFYRLLKAMLPDWERRLVRLNQCVAK
jgi:predicted metal-dependent hydrolase